LTLIGDGKGTIVGCLVGVSTSEELEAAIAAALS
jgi:hypothetical protein